MSKQPKTEAPAKVAKKYAPTRMEVVKTVVIAVLVTAILAFVAGMRFANQHRAEIDRAVSAVEPEKAVATQGK